MQIDNNELVKKAMDLSREKKFEDAEQLYKEFIETIKASGVDTCSCKYTQCERHGNCFECVMIHRGHGEHLPQCFWDIINLRIEHLSELTEKSSRIQNKK